MNEELRNLSQSTESESSRVVEQIMAMFEKDQDIRTRAAANRGALEKPEDLLVDAQNTEKMKKIVAEIGWPTISKVGEEISHQAWFLVQHADHDIAWQKQCLAILQEQPAGEILPREIAYLDDRIRVSEGRPQLYGTQTSFIDGKITLQPIEDPDHVDERRKKAGIKKPLAEYVDELEQFASQIMKNSQEHETLATTAQDIYQRYGVSSFRELDTKFMAEDQKLMRTFSWDPNNPDLMINQIKQSLEQCDPSKLTDEDQEWRKEILWMWHHHAVSAALGKNGNRDVALAMTERALSYQTPDHTNHITRLYFLLLTDKIDDARAWVEAIPDDVERETGRGMIQEYVNGHWFPPK